MQFLLGFGLAFGLGFACMGPEGSLEVREADALKSFRFLETRPTYGVASPWSRLSEAWYDLHVAQD